MGEVYDFSTGKKQFEAGFPTEETDILPGSAREYKEEDDHHQQNWIEETINDNPAEIEECFIHLHPLTVATIENMDDSDRQVDLDEFMVDSLPIIEELARHRGCSKLEILDTLEEWCDKPYHNDTEALKNIWKLGYLYSTGVIHTEKLVSRLEQTEQNDAQTKKYANATISNLMNHPQAVLNCLNATNIYLCERATGGVFLDKRPQDPSEEELTSFQLEALRVLGSQHMEERPFAAWYLLSRSSIWREGNAFIKPLIDSIEDNQVGISGVDKNSPEIEDLDAIDENVRFVVAKDWDGWRTKLHSQQRNNLIINGALEYGDTPFYEAYQSMGRYGSSDELRASIRSKVYEVHHLAEKLKR